MCYLDGKVLLMMVVLFVMPLADQLVLKFLKVVTTWLMLVIAILLDFLHFIMGIDIVYGKDREMGDVAEDPFVAEQNLGNADVTLLVTDESDSNTELNFYLPWSRCHLILRSLDGHLGTMSAWMQGTTSRMPQVLERLEKHEFNGPDKYKASKAIYQDPLHVDLLFSLDSTEVREYVLTLI
ncbi:hypothetical protein ZIOFF_014409 [Zingiber officinale]|uniref:Uncharacterized protein n=1 Tax=Zingiber officinale TaxID=94328 RepID=A0A8J5I0J2_ZINOF|nr:hypothetical protein ZIOFF_014409 [Zingiber officinale]